MKLKNWNKLRTALIELLILEIPECVEQKNDITLDKVMKYDIN